MKEITPEMYAALKQPLPKEAISPHPTKKFLSTIKAIYVTERLNDVFGAGKWTIKTDFINMEGKMVVCKTILEIPDYGVYYECFGGNDNVDTGDAFKGATTDAITKIGSYLGIAIDVFKGMKDAVNAAAASKNVAAVTSTTQVEKTQQSANKPLNFEDFKKECLSKKTKEELNVYWKSVKPTMTDPKIGELFNELKTKFA